MGAVTAMFGVNDAQLEAWYAGREGALVGQREDVRLALGCAGGEASALEAFDVRFRPVIAAVVKRLGRSELADELAQLVRERLLLGAAGKRPRIEEYGARGSLESFVRAVAMRTCLNLMEQRERLQGVDSDDALLDLPSPEPDPELELLKTKYRAEFKTALSAALASLEPQERTALRQYYIDGLGLAELGRLHGWSLATASRRVAAGRAALLGSTRERLSSQLGLSGRDVDSVLRLIESQLSVDGL